MPFFIGWVENFDEITLSCMVKKIEANSCFSIFGKNLKNQNGRHFWGGENFFKLQRVHSFGKNLKNQNGRHFWGGENFLKIAKSTMLRYPVD